MKNQRYILYMLVILVLGSCDIISGDSSSDPIEPIEITTNNNLYAPDDTVTVTIVNNMEDSLQILNSGCFALERAYLPKMHIEIKNNGTWEIARGQWCAGIPMQPTKIASGESHTVSFRIGFTRTPLPEGLYKYNIGIRRVDGSFSGEPLNNELLYSNEFEVKDS